MAQEADVTARFIPNTNGLLHGIRDNSRKVYSTHAWYRSGRPGIRSRTLTINGRELARVLTGNYSFGFRVDPANGSRHIKVIVASKPSRSLQGGYFDSIYCSIRDLNETRWHFLFTMISRRIYHRLPSLRKGTEPHRQTIVNFLLISVRVKFHL